MEDEINFIDKIIKKTLNTDKEQPRTTWKGMEAYMNQKGVLSKSNTFFPISHNVKTDIVMFSGMLIITTGIFYFTNQQEETDNEPVKIEKINVKQKDDTTNKNIRQAKELNTKKDSAAFIVTNNKKSDTDKKVKIKVEVPVHKKVIIKKQIIIKDTLN